MIFRAKIRQREGYVYSNKEESSKKTISLLVDMIVNTFKFRNNFNNNENLILYNKHVQFINRLTGLVFSFLYVPML